MFVGTKKQAQEAVAEQATRVGMPYVNERWLGGMLTNFQTVYKRLQRLKELEQIDFDDVAGSGMTKKELLVLRRERDKLLRTLGGIREMTKIPSAVWIVDTNKEAIAVGEAHKLGIPVIAILDSNCDPDVVDFPIPGNDDAIRAVGLLTRVIADAVAEGLVARASGATAGSAAEPLAEWEAELLAAHTEAAATEAVATEAVAVAEVADAVAEEAVVEAVAAEVAAEEAVAEAVVAEAVAEEAVVEAAAGELPVEVAEVAVAEAVVDEAVAVEAVAEAAEAESVAEEAVAVAVVADAVAEEAVAEAVVAEAVEIEVEAEAVEPIEAAERLRVVPTRTTSTPGCPGCAMTGPARARRSAGGPALETQSGAHVPHRERTAHGCDHRRGRQEAPRPHLRRHDGVQEGAHRG